MTVSYDADDVVRYMISYSFKKGNPINNLQMQRLLYLIWIDYYNYRKEFFFDDEFSAWKFSPVITKIYYEFCSDGGNPITEVFACKLKNNDALFVEKFIDEYGKEKVPALTEKVQRRAGVWDKVFNRHRKMGAGDGLLISFNLIIENECGREGFTHRVDVI